MAIGGVHNGRLYNATVDLECEDERCYPPGRATLYLSLEEAETLGINPPAGLTFASGLRHILRGDPDVVMVSEIRDRETAELFVEATKYKAA